MIQPIRTRLAFAAAICALSLPIAAKAAGPSQSDALVALEAKWSKAMVANDLAALDGIIASDWMGQNQTGVMTSKAAFLADLKAGKNKITSMKNRDVHARIIGDIAIVQGSDDEVSSYKDKDSSGAYSWMDVFQKRAGKWVAIASQNTPVTPKK